MKRRVLATIFSLGVGILALPVHATPVAYEPVSYEIGSYSQDGYSASWVHEATGCAGAGPTTRLPLYMCGDALPSIEGTVKGNYYRHGGYLQVTGGSLKIGNGNYAVGSGYLGSFRAGSVWFLKLENFGMFLFENLDKGKGLPNYFDYDKFILWGQNLSAYFCRPGKRYCGPRWGIDLYGKRTSVPEPGVLALLGIGLLAIAATRRRRNVKTCDVPA